MSRLCSFIVTLLFFLSGCSPNGNTDVSNDARVPENTLSEVGSETDVKSSDISMSREQIIAKRDEMYRTAFDSAAIEDVDGSRYSLKVVNIGNLYLPTGRIIICDPYWADPEDLFAALTRTVTPGKYAVVLSVADFGGDNTRVALAKLVFSDEAVEEWEMALIPGESIDQLKGWQYFGYGVDAHTGCFVDEKTLKQFAKEIDDNVGQNSLADQMFDAMEKNNHRWANFSLEEKTGQNIAMFMSGWGDGRYASYFGIDRNGQVACLLTDFNVIPWIPDDELFESVD